MATQVNFSQFAVFPVAAAVASYEYAHNVTPLVVCGVGMLGIMMLTCAFIATEYIESDEIEAVVRRSLLGSLLVVVATAFFAPIILCAIDFAPTVVAFCNTHMPQLPLA